jgi:hypothetical protein
VNGLHIRRESYGGQSLACSASRVICSANSRVTTPHICRIRGRRVEGGRSRPRAASHSTAARSSRAARCWAACTTKNHASRVRHGQAATLTCAACSERAILAEGDESSDSDTDGDATTDTESGDGDGDATTDTESGDGDPSEDACGCEEGQLCVGDCDWGDFNPDEVENPRCIDDAICFEHGFDSPECMGLACNAPWSEPLGVCGDSADYNIICEPFSPPQSCSELSQDCPDAKCVAREPDRWGFNTTRCVPIVGTGAAGEPCTSEGADPESEGTDSCDATSMCWSGTLVAEPFMGTCRPFCDEDAGCPDGMTCEAVLSTPFYLCLPSP